MNQTIGALKYEYVNRLKKQIKLYKQYPELFEDDGFRTKYVQVGDKLAALALLYTKLLRKCELKRLKEKNKAKKAS